MTQVMCKQRGCEGTWPEKQYCIDNGTMIAELGRRMLQTQDQPHSRQVQLTRP